MDKSSSLGMPMAPIGAYSRSTNHQSLGMPETPSCSSSSISGRLSNTTFLFVHAISVRSWSVRCFSFQYFFVCFILLNKLLDPSKGLLERDTLCFHCQEHPSSRFY